jgi:host factor-I protein
MDTLSLRNDIDKPSRQSAERQSSQTSTKPASNVLQANFLGKLIGHTVTVYLVNGIRLSGQLQQMDQYTLLLGGAEGGPPQLVFKHAISTIQPADTGGGGHRWPPGRMSRNRLPERDYNRAVRDTEDTQTEDY